MPVSSSDSMPLGAPAPPFELPGVDGETWSLDRFADAKATVVMFICNHCPYVQAIEDRLIALARDLQPRGAAFVGIMSNDVSRYPDDHPDRMKARAKEKGYPFPYLYDETQEVARAYDAVCTPDLYVFDGDHKLAYRGRLDDSWRDPAAVTREELREAVEAVLAGEQPSPEQNPSMGCSIKWK